MNIEADIKLALISDLHVYDDLPEHELQPSYVRVGAVDSAAGTNPILDLASLIKEHELRADVLLCLGDIADKARPTGLEYGWRRINDIATQLASAMVLATSGNHDCDSRHHYNDYDAKGVLQALEPTYPIHDEAAADQYWSRNFVVVELEHCRIVCVNSSAYHGGAPSEVDHGRITAKTIDRLRKVLQNTSEKPLNVLMCHHHPHSHAEIELGEQDVMKNGQALLELLACGEYGRWVIIHGHKHHPKLSYAQGHGGSPAVLACGSLSASLYPALGTNVRNQFHILTANVSDITQFGLAGIIYSWEWTFGAGWTVASDRSGLPARAGFGYRCDPTQLAATIAAAVGQDPRIPWLQVELAVPQVKFILPAEFDIVQRRLRNAWGIEILRRDGLPFEIGRLQ